MNAPASRRFAVRKIERPVSYDAPRTFIAGTVKPPTSPRPRARYSSLIDAARTPTDWPICQINQRASSRCCASPKTATRDTSNDAVRVALGKQVPFPAGRFGVRAPEHRVGKLFPELYPGLIERVHAVKRSGVN